MTRQQLDYDISIRADKARRARRRGMSGAFEDSQRVCARKGCESRAAYRAPKSRDRLDDYQWFCLEHVREYNQRWDYFSQFEADEIERVRREAQLWERPTWHMGRAGSWRAALDPHAEGRAWSRLGFDGPDQVLGASATINPGEKNPLHPRRRLLPRAEMKALETMGLDENVSGAEIRRRYAELVKQLHPDINGGDRTAESRLKAVLAAWAVLKKSVFFR